MTCLLIKIYALDKKKDIEKYHLASPTQQTCHCPFSQKKKKKTHGIILGPHLMLSDSQHPHVLNN